MPSSVLISPVYNNYKFAMSITNSKLMDNKNDNWIFNIKRPELILGDK